MRLAVEIQGRFLLRCVKRHVVRKAGRIVSTERVRGWPRRERITVEGPESLIAALAAHFAPDRLAEVAPGVATFLADAFARGETANVRRSARRAITASVPRVRALPDQQLRQLALDHDSEAIDRLVREEASFRAQRN